MTSLPEGRWMLRALTCLPLHRSSLLVTSSAPLGKSLLIPGPSSLHL